MNNDLLLEASVKLASARREIDRLIASNTKLGVDLTCAKSAIRQAWPYLDDDHKLPHLCATQGFRDARARLGRIIGEDEK